MNIYHSHTVGKKIKQRFSLSRKHNRLVRGFFVIELCFKTRDLTTIFHDRQASNKIDRTSIVTSFWIKIETRKARSGFKEKISHTHDVVSFYRIEEK